MFEKIINWFKPKKIKTIMSGDSYRDTKEIIVSGPSLISRIKLWYHNNSIDILPITVISCFLLGGIGLIYWAFKADMRRQAENEAPYISSKDIALADIIKNHGGGVKHSSYHHHEFEGGTGCLGMTIQVDVSHQKPNGKYTESSYCCDGKSCRLFSSKEF